MGRLGRLEENERRIKRDVRLFVIGFGAVLVFLLFASLSKANNSGGSTVPHACNDSSCGGKAVPVASSHITPTTPQSGVVGIVKTRMAVCTSAGCASPPTMRRGFGLRSLFSR